MSNNGNNCCIYVYKVVGRPEKVLEEECWDPLLGATEAYEFTTELVTCGTKISEWREFI